MKPKMKFMLIAVLFAFVALPVFAQQATLKRNSILRSDSSSSSQALEHLKTGATVTIENTTPENGYYQAKANDGQEGWVWAKNISLENLTGNPTQPTSGPSSPDNSAQCDDSLWDHVYHPQRLIVQQKCLAVTGTIVDATNGRKADGVRHEADGDTHGWLQVDPQFSNLIDSGNAQFENGNLVFEIVCKFRVTQADAVASCPSTYQTPIHLPPIGSHVRIVGSYVQDTNHGKWMEIHPVTSIEIIPDP
ncbi:MAG TPA: SH3 domain-containing protein [Terriglobales bacterium]|nr:SH3 domain-containing protein [Terriglobales bacterium]